MKKLILTAAAIALLPSLAMANDTYASRQNGLERMFNVREQRDTTRVPTDLPSSEIAKVQTILKNERFYRYAVDGNWGRETVSSLIQFQRQHDLPATGRVDVKTAEELNKFGSFYQVFVNTRPDNNGPKVVVKDVSKKVHPH